MLKFYKIFYKKPEDTEWKEDTLRHVGDSVYVGVDEFERAGYETRIEEV